MSGRAPKQKGNRFERECVNELQQFSIGAERIPLSGAAGGSFSGDISVPVQGDDWLGECKVRRNGFHQLYGWLAGNRLLFVKQDRREPLVVMRLHDFAQLAKLQANEVSGHINHPPIARKLALRSEPTEGEGYSG